MYYYDSEIVIKLKQFMVAYNIKDIKMRMLKIPELLVIQGFPENYELIGTAADKKKYIDNSVHPLVPKAWTESLADILHTSVTFTHFSNNYHGRVSTTEGDHQRG